MKMLIATMLISMTQVSLAQEVQISTQTRATGNAQVIAQSVTSCSTPNALDMFRRDQLITVESAYSYKICKEYVTSDFKVTGQMWNRKYDEIVESRKLSYRLEEVRQSSSKLLFGSKDDLISITEFLLATEAASSKCKLEQSQTLQRQVDINSTPCR